MQQSSGLHTCNFIKKRLQNGCFSVNIPKDLATAFLKKQLWWLLLNYVLVSEFFFLKKLVKILPLNSLACFICKYKGLQVCQLSWEHLSFLQNLLNFIITKYLKQEVDDDLSVCMDERSPCGLSITGDIKIYQCHVMKR